MAGNVGKVAVAVAGGCSAVAVVVAAAVAGHRLAVLQREVGEVRRDVAALHGLAANEAAVYLRGYIAGAATDDDGRGPSPVV